MTELEYLLTALQRRQNAGEPTNLRDVLLEAVQAMNRDDEEEADRCLTDENYR